MGEIYTVDGENIRLTSALPVVFLEELEIGHRGNEHGKLRLKAVVGGEKEENILRRYWFGERILVEIKEEEWEPLFQGRIGRLLCRKENSLLSVEVEADGETVCLDGKRKAGFFQDPDMTYGEVIQKVMAACEGAAFIWGEYGDRPVGGPLIQYDETDWEFLVRLCSHFHGRLFPELKTGKPHFYFGLHKGRERSANAAEIMENGICTGFPESHAFYLMARTKENWQMGDYLMYEGQCCHVYERNVRFDGGELFFTYKLGTGGMYREKKKYNESLTGARFTGIVERTEGESVYLRLDMDKEEKAGYPWEWAPETNNLCYCMPEKGTGAALVFSSAEEKSGYLVLAETGSPECGGYGNGDGSPQNREFATKWNKRIGLYPSQLFLEGAGGGTEIALKDMDGIWLGSQGNLSVSAQGNLYLEGKSISVAAPLETVCRTPQANIELCRNINLYAPAGVQTVGTGNAAQKVQTDGTGDAAQKVRTDGTGQEEKGHWQASYTALAAIPAMDLKVNGGTEEAVDIFTLGSIPKIAKGSVTIAMSEVMEGKKECECSFPKAFRSMDNYMVKGGYALPRENEEEL